MSDIFWIFVSIFFIIFMVYTDDDGVSNFGKINQLLDYKYEEMMDGEATRKGY